MWLVTWVTAARVWSWSDESLEGWVETLCLLRSAKNWQQNNMCGYSRAEWSLLKQLTDHGLKILYHTDLLYLFISRNYEHGLVVMGDEILQCEIHLWKALSNIIDCVTRRWGVRPGSRNEVGLVVAVVTTATWMVYAVSIDGCNYFGGNYSFGTDKEVVSIRLWYMAEFILIIFSG